MDNTVFTPDEWWEACGLHRAIHALLDWHTLDDEAIVRALEDGPAPVFPEIREWRHG